MHQQGSFLILNGEVCVEDLVYWIWLGQIAEAGQIKTDEILNGQCESPRALFERFNSDMVPEGVLKRRQKLPPRNLGAAQEILQGCLRVGCEIITYKDVQYPERLRQISAAPPVLYAKGNLDLLFELEYNGAVCVVGSRACTEYGVCVTRELVAGLVDAGVITVSGFALGIDTVVHEETLAAGGKTIAVLGCGVEIDYPRGNRDLRQRMLENSSLFLSEHPPFAKATKFNFPSRNRILSGLSDGVLVTQAGLKSGSLITANWCSQQGRDVFSVPHNLGNLNTVGCNLLIRDGAVVVTEVNDILAVLRSKYSSIKLAMSAARQPNLAEKHKTPMIDIAGLSVVAQKVFACLRDVPKPLDILVAELGIGPGELLAGITELELCGAIHVQPGALYGL
ncbi:MAG: DNA-processing protein DprA [Oscillospiraceae bacterium]|nr:DNA-processing protein DprA [Oscillospiraceae bacterium]